MIFSSFKEIYVELFSFSANTKETSRENIFTNNKKVFSFLKITLINSFQFFQFFPSRNNKKKKAFPSFKNNFS